MNLGTDMVSVTGTSQFYANPELSHFGVSQRNEPRGWFYCLPCFRQVFAPASNSLLKEQHLADRYENLKESGTSKAGTGAAEKRFLVFDQSGDQTTLIFSSALGLITRVWGVAKQATPQKTEAKNLFRAFAWDYEMVLQGDAPPLYVEDVHSMLHNRILVLLSRIAQDKKAKLVLFHASNSALLKEQHLADRYENLKESGTSKAGTGAAEKRFLVFDQSGDQTTLIFSSAIGTPTKCLSSWGPKSPAAGNFNGDVPMAKATMNLHSGPISTDVSYHKGTDVQSEMHEDTEELNALLYSDDDSEYSEDEEVTSTGHSPSTMTAQDEQFEGGSEEVDSSTRLIKKRKLLDGSYGCLPLLMDTANLGNFNRYSEYEDDADSSCAKGQNPGSGDTDSSSSNKRMRKDKIRESVTVLRSIIPGGEGKDAVAVLDEAINYLKSLKLKAKTLGLNTL
ncbi:hypothetical protein GOBAR_AA09027 [Gossypium barbadense]|uniref:BHLH domain-containing protein n=1 Tax=Gossypium barbadense TaxID=3634 RepID=A0A2P5Y7M6_GOSBA|nr:hypothetical protein GOBAR_AA09027 [Gossypium barbadense]